MAMPVLISGIFSFFSDFFKRFTYQAMLKFLAFVSVSTLMLAEFSFLLVLCSLVLKFVLFVFEKINYVFSYTDSVMDSHSASDSYVYVAFSVLDTLGVFKAFKEVFTMFTPVFESFFVFLISSLLFSVFSKVVKNIASIWRIFTWG